VARVVSQDSQSQLMLDEDEDEFTPLKDEKGCQKVTNFT